MQYKGRDARLATDSLLNNQNRRIDSYFILFFLFGRDSFQVGDFNIDRMPFFFPFDPHCSPSLELKIDIKLAFNLLHLLQVFTHLFSSLFHFLSMARRSPRKKAISPVPVVESDDEGFLAVVSDNSDQYVVLCFSFVNKVFLIFSYIAWMRRKLSFLNIQMVKKVPPTKTKRACSLLKSNVSPSKREIPQLQLLELMMKMCKSTLLWFLCFSYLCIHSIEITPPPTPSPVKAAGGKKRAVADCESDEEDVFVPRYGYIIFNILFVKDFYILALPGTALRRPVPKRLILLPQSPLANLSLMQRCTYLFFNLFLDGLTSIFL